MLVPTSDGIESKLVSREWPEPALRPRLAVVLDARVADLVLTNASVYTMDADVPTAAAVAITGARITAVCQTVEEARDYVGDATRVIDLEGAFVTPGIIDGPVYFNREGELINDDKLMTVLD